ncbi:MAG: hypothetical protein K2L25_01140 [Alphaproteobacteria bacterium]|nr:hypothetical protein [Alphaproteobacteria bacterium]
MKNKNGFRVSRIGNERTPRLIILLCNPGGNPKWPRRFPEYAMDKDGCYKQIGMNFSQVREYCEWWDNVLNVTDKYVKDSDILALEYYPYHTPGMCKETNNKALWDDFAKNSLEQNKKLLQKHMGNGVPVFGYYWGNWLKENIPGLTKYCYQSKNTRGQASKLHDLKDFLEHENFK